MALLANLLSFTLFAAAGSHSQYWYALPLIVAVSLVYGATRHELPRPIFLHAARAAIWISGFMLALLMILLLADWWFL